MKRVCAVCACTCALVVHGAVAAQGTPRFEVTPHVGYYVPLNELGPAAPSGGVWYLRLERADPSVSFDLTARALWPGARVSTRVHGFFALPARTTGVFECYPLLACPAVLLPTDADVAVWGALADIVLTPSPKDARARPFVVLGAGIKGYRYDWSAPPVLVGRGAYAESDLALHAGIGLELDVAGAPIRLEVSDYWSGEGRRLEGPGAGDVGPRRAAQHDLGITLGWRLLRF